MSDAATRVLTEPASSFDQHVLSKFLKIFPKVLGALEISIGIGLLIISIWAKLYNVLWSRLLSILTGSVTVTAACMHSTRWIRISQVLSWLNFMAALISIPFYIFKFLSFGAVPLIFLLVCDVLTFIISLAVAATSCDCCRKKSRRVNYIGVSYVTDEYTVIHCRRGLFTNTLIYYEDPYLPLPVFSLHPSAPPAEYTLSPPSYNEVPPPPIYHPHPSAPPLNYTGPSAAPPAYEDINGSFAVH